jgi:hypothetical protein
MPKISRSTNKAKSIDRVSYLKDKMKKSPYHQIKDSKLSEAKSGYQWIYVCNYLKELKEADGFDQLMNSKYFTQPEKDYILFNITKIDEIVENGVGAFQANVAAFIMEAAGVEFDEEE